MLYVLKESDAKEKGNIAPPTAAPGHTFSTLGESYTGTYALLLRYAHTVLSLLLPYWFLAFFHNYDGAKVYENGVALHVIWLNNM